ncbi:MAG: hypothetical protein SF051_03340 [Elusimicrobiota bacterium]|nr:hypothetical protein [Elusimicrobiota bacterium]
MRARAAALLGAVALTAAAFASRLPAGPDFILPRRGGYALFQAAWALLGTPASRTAFAAAVTLMALAASVLLLLELRAAARPRRPRGAAGWAGLVAGPAFAAVLAWRGWSSGQDLIQLVWFPWECLDAREPLVVFALTAVLLGVAATASLAWIEGRRKTATRLLLALIAADVLGLASTRAYGVGESVAAPSPSRTAYTLLTEERDGPGHELYVLAPGAFGPDPRPALHRLLAGRRDARTLPALRELYRAEAMRWDEEGLRRALLLGASLGDGLARSLLLSHLESARPTPAAVAALGAVADDDAYRIGPVGAARIARVYARLGERERAEAWAARASIPAGLLGLDGGGALRPGRVTGKIKAPPAARVALYRRPDASAPYLLDASAFVGAAEPDASGRFSFEGLGAGRYFLVIAFPAPSQGFPEGVSVAGHRGDIVLDSRTAAVERPPVTVRAR